MSRELSTIDSRNQMRVLRAPHGRDFCSNDYLSLSRHPTIVSAVQRALLEHGYGSSSSRYIRGEREQFSELEQNLASFKGCERALIFGSGYAANVGVLAAIIKKNDVVFSDQLNHASIIDGIRLSGALVKIFPHNDVNALNAMLTGVEDRSVQKFIVTESLFSMDGDAAPLATYAQLARRHNAALIVDEAHAVGIFGNQGAGLIDHTGIGNDVLLSINGLGKAFGCYGAFVAGSDVVINYLVQHARTLMFSTALPPLCAAAIDASLKLVIQGEHLREQLFRNASLLNQLFANAGLLTNASFVSPIIPIIIGDNLRTTSIAAHLRQESFDVRAIRPPTVPPNSARLRITANCSQSEQSIHDLVSYVVNKL